MGDGKASLRRRPGTFLHLVQAEKRQLSVVSRSENFESWDAEMERRQKIDVFSRWEAEWLPVIWNRTGKAHQRWR